VARHWERSATGILLTGMGRDGAAGLLAMREAGHLTIAQDQSSSAVYGMPRAAAEIGAVQQVLSLDNIIAALSGKIAGPA
jgi:two-component system response regulator WspF